MFVLHSPTLAVGVGRVCATPSSMSTGRTLIVQGMAELVLPSACQLLSAVWSPLVAPLKDKVTRLEAMSAMATENAAGMFKPPMYKR